MVHDDDTGRRVGFTISGRDLPSRPSRPKQLPPKKIQDQIIRMAQRPGVNVERIYAYFRRKRHDISRDMIRYVLYNARAGRRT